MFNLFTSDKEKEPDWIAQANETKERWFVFLEKLETKMQELCEAAIPELEDSFKNDDDIYKRTHGRLLAGINGQLENIRRKAYDTYDEKIQGFYQTVQGNVSALSPHYNMLFNFRNECSNRYHRQFDDKLHYWQEQLKNTGKENLEIKYQALLDEFEAIKNKFNCRQCGAPLHINQIFFINTYITCPHCQSQNSFEPSTQAKQLEHLGRELAEQRTAPLLQAYENELQKERDLYQQKHETALSMIHEKDKKRREQTNLLTEDLERQRQQAIRNAPGLYETYLRAMFDEWNKIVPSLAPQNEKFYQRMLSDFRNR